MDFVQQVVARLQNVVTPPVERDLDVRTVAPLGNCLYAEAVGADDLLFINHRIADDVGFDWSDYEHANPRGGPLIHTARRVFDEMIHKS